MSTNPVTTFLGGLWRPRPWPVLLTGLGITALGLVAVTLGDPLVPLRVLLFLAGLILAGAGVSLRFKTAGQAFEERMETAGVLAVAAFAALLAFLGADPTWDSMQMVLVVMIVVALFGVVLVLLPKPARLIVGGALILFHFGGVLTAATTIDPPGSQAPWISQELWVHVYRPYLQFLYLNNAYHFYSPEPGPPSLVWFHIKYQNGKVKWFKIPDRDNDPVPLHHTRLLSVTESTSVVSLQPPQDAARWAELQKSRRDAGRKAEIPVEDENYIVSVNFQYQEAQPYSQRLLETYVRHVASVYPWLGDPNNTLKSIKVYRFRQTIINPLPMAQGRSPVGPWLFVGYYQGEYDGMGKLVRADDPFRFWYMPIYYRQTTAPGSPKPEFELVDCLTRHAQLDLDNPKAPVDPNDSPWGDAAEDSKP